MSAKKVVRRHHEGSIFYNKKSKRWEISISAGYDGKGRRRRIRRIAHSRSDAKAILD